MPALDFPSSPTLDQEYTAAGRTWKWNGTSWITVTPALASGDVTAALGYTPLSSASADSAYLKLTGGTLSDSVGMVNAPSAWSGAYKAYQVGTTSFGGGSGTTGAVFANNLYYDGTDWRYIVTGAGSVIIQSDGAINVYGVASGTAGAVATLGTPELSIALNGNTTGSYYVNSYTEKPYTANSGTALTLDLANGSSQLITLTGSCTFTMPTPTAGKSFVVQLKTGSGSFTAIFSGVKWAGGTAPTITTTASRLDLFSFFADGTNWYGVTAGQSYTP